MPGAIEELIRKHNVHRLEFLAKRADRACRDDSLDAQHLHRVDVRAKRDLSRQKLMSSSMPRKKRNSLIGERADKERVRRLAKRSRKGDLFDIGQTRHLIQPASADDSDLCSWHSLSFEHRDAW